MKVVQVLAWAMWSLACALTPLPSLAADYPTPKEGSWVVRDFRFQTGEVLPELRLHYTTLGPPTGEPVLSLHGTTGSGTGMLTPAFAGELFGPGQPLDAGRYYIILPDAIGTGKSSKPSDGLRASFPKYGYDDMVHAQYRLVTEHLGVRHLRLVLGNSMGGMQTWIWAQRYPDFRHHSPSDILEAAPGGPAAECAPRDEVALPGGASAKDLGFWFSIRDYLAQNGGHAPSLMLRADQVVQ